MSKIQAIIGELKDVYDGDAWHGPSLKETLTGVTARQAAAKPLANAHSIWELALHIAGWEDVFRHRLNGHVITEPEDGDFPPATDVNEDSWGRALSKLDESHRQLIAAVAELTEDRLGEIVPGKDYTVEYMLRGLVRHHVYHAGQISLLKKVD
jgi:uncharacterized damage-inducible protein DinB